MTYRTRTYIAAEWDGDRDLVDVLRKWNDNEYWGLRFNDAHDLKESRDTSLNCTIKASLRERLAASKTFVLIVGKNTDSVTAGSCRYCSDYGSWYHSCKRGHTVDMKSYIDFECNYAARNIGRIIVLYNSTRVDKSKCPLALRDRGVHVPALCWGYDGNLRWDYQRIKKAIES